MRTTTCFGDGTSGTFLIIASVYWTKIHCNSVSRIDNFVNVNVLNSVASSHVLSYRILKLCKKRRTNIWISRSPYRQCWLSWVIIAHAQFSQVTLMVPKYHSLDAPRSLGRKSVFCTFLPVLYRVCNAQSTFYTRVHILNPVHNV